MAAAGSPLPSNAELAGLFERIARYLSLHGEQTYRVLAYERAALVLRDYPGSAADLALAGELRALPGIGAATESKVLEYLRSGCIRLLADLEASYPAGLLELMRVPGLGAAKVRLLWEQLGVSDVDGLREACLASQVQEIKGMGKRSQDKILEALDRYQARSDRLLLGEVEPVAQRLLEQLLRIPGVERAAYAGSLRRRRSTVKDIDLVAGAREAASVMCEFGAFPELAQVSQAGETKLVAETQGGVSVDLRVVDPEAYGSLLQHATGSAAHNVALRGYAQRKGFKVSEYGLEDVATGTLRPLAVESEVYGALGLPFIPPELREDRGEIEAAAAGRLPRLIELKDLRGDLHVHTSWSDGKAGIMDMALAAQARGLDYICISDHSRSLAMTRGLDPSLLEEQAGEIRSCNARLPDFRILCGCEVDILADGSLDLPDEVLARLDFVIASIHSAFAQPGERIMARLEAAAQNPHVDAIAHPSGRLLGTRAPYALDIELLVQMAEETGTALEINSSYYRLDLSARGARLAKDSGVKMVINSDAHGPSGFELLRFGIGEARRGWVEPVDVLNTATWAELCDMLRLPAGSA